MYNASNYKQGFPMTTQQEFDKRYISSSEIMKTLNVSRTAIHEARRTGKLPNPIDIQGKIFIWEREALKEYIEAWELILKVRRHGVSE